MDVLLEAVESVLPAEPRSARSYGPFLPVVTQAVLGMGTGMGKSWAGGGRRTVRRPQQKKDLERASASLARLQQSCVEDQECAHRGGWNGGWQKCRALLEEDVEFNLQLCPEHLGEHVLWRMAKYALEGNESAGLSKLEPLEGGCLVCGRIELEDGEEPELVHCAVCGVPGHSSCVREQFATLPAVEEESEVGMLCHGCFVERHLECALVLAIWELTGARAVLIVEGGAEMLDDENGPFWSAAREQARGRGFLVRPEKAPAVTVSPFRSVQKANKPRAPVEAVGVAGKARVPKEKPAEEWKPRKGARLKVQVRAGDQAGAPPRRVVTEGEPQPEGGVKEDVRRQVGEQLAEAMRGQTGGPQGLQAMLRAVSKCTQGVCPTGARDGYKEDQVGAPNTPGAWDVVNWNGMRAHTPQGKKQMTRLIGAERVDLVVRNRDCPEEEGLEQTMKLGELEVSVTQKGKKVPDRLTVVRFFGYARHEWEDYRVCGQSVYAEGHPDFAFFQIMSTMIAARFYFLELMAVHLGSEGGLEWGVVWRYLTMFTDRHFFGTALESGSMLDDRIYTAYADPTHRDTRLGVLAGESVQPLLLDRAKSLGLAESALAGRGQWGQKAVGAGGGLAKEVAGTLPKSCVLCGSLSHQYTQGSYGHLAEHKITVTCPLTLSDGSPCGGLHAFSGPLKSPCRGGLEPNRKWK